MHTPRLKFQCQVLPLIKNTVVRRWVFVGKCTISASAVNRRHGRCWRAREVRRGRWWEDDHRVTCGHKVFSLKTKVGQLEAR